MSCPVCNTDQIAYEAIEQEYDGKYGKFTAKALRYVCTACHWIWATPDMREFNNMEYERGKKIAKAQTLGGRFRSFFRR